MKTRQSGFNLIELLIVIVILALLATIAMPSFQSFIRNTRLANVRSELAENVKNLERYYTQKGTFVGFNANSLVQNQYFDISFDPEAEAPNPSDSGFTLRATPNTNNPNETCNIYMNDSNIFWASSSECPGYEEPHVN